MPTGTEDKIRELAYQKWLDEGCPEGRAEAHWHEAAEAVKKTAPKAKKPAAAKTAGKTAAKKAPAKAADKPAAKRTSAKKKAPA